MSSAKYSATHYCNHIELFILIYSFERIQALNFYLKLICNLYVDFSYNVWNNKTIFYK
jgi:hypothetical protein